ncbi:MAG: leucine-rich repeat domain-containing protein, partial [Acutalibacteraceae bacterium]
MGTNLKKSFKRTFLFSSVVVIALAVFAFAGFAADKTVVSSGSCGETIYDDDGNISGYSDNVTWTLYDDGELVISGSGEMGDFECKNILPKVPYASYSYDSSGDPSDKTISSVVIENGITKIGTYAFCGLSSLTEMEIPDGVETISDYSFEYCKNLKSITFSNAVKKIGSYAFRSCESLTNVEIPSNVTSIGSYAFLFCKSLTRVEIPASMLSIGNRAFESCSMLTEINVDSNNTKYESENGVLFNKGKTTIITYPTGKTDTEYLIPDSVTKIGAYAFYKCINLEKMNIPNSVSVIDSCAFEMCNNLNNITLANSVNEIRSFAFSGCNNLTSITIPYSVTNIDYWAFRKCINLKEINVDSQSKTFESENGILFSKGKTTILKYPEGKTDEEYVIPDSVTKIGYCAFEYCRYLKDLTISENVTTMSSWTFSYCNLLTNVTIKGSMANIREDSFCACKNLTTITIPNTVTDIKYNAFESCNSLKDVYYTGTQEQWQSISIEIGNECLQNATIHTISEPETNKTIDFKNQNGIMTVYGSGEIPSCDENALHSWDQSKDDVTTLIIDGISSIGSNSFCDFPSLVNVIIISDSITIEQNAFVNCPKLENVIV